MERAVGFHDAPPLLDDFREAFGTYGQNGELEDRDWSSEWIAVRSAQEVTSASHGVFTRLLKDTSFVEENAGGIGRAGQHGFLAAKSISLQPIVTALHGQPGGVGGRDGKN